MGLFLNSQETRTELQERIAAELQARQKDQPKIKAEEVDPAFLEHQHHTRLAGVLIVVLSIVAIIIATIIVSVR